MVFAVSDNASGSLRFGKIAASAGSESEINCYADVESVLAEERREGVEIQPFGAEDTGAVLAQIDAQFSRKDFHHEALGRALKQE